MKGLVFQQHVESRLEIIGETFRQGDALQCAIVVKNNSQTPIRFEELFFCLAKGTMKLVKAKEAGAFEVLEIAPLESGGSVAPGDSVAINHSFILDKNCSISDSATSLCLLYGLKRDGITPAHLQIPVLPHSDIEGILTILETSFQFDPKGCKSKGDWVIAKLKPPTGGKFRTVDSLELCFHFTAKTLTLRYVFSVKRLEASSADLTMKKKKLEISRELERSEYFSSAGFIDSALVEPILEEALAQVRSGF